MSKNKKRIQRLPDDVKQQLIECFEALISDALSYDSGNFKSIKRSSGVLRMLFYDTTNSHSIINQIDNKSKIPMVSFSNYKEKDYLYYGQIFCARFWELPPAINQHYDTFLFYPDKANCFNVSFTDWWNGVVFRLDDTKFTRGNLILSIANKDGGVHFDPTIDEGYIHLINGDTGFKINPKENNHLILGGSPNANNEEVKFKDLHLALMREIVHESILSLNRYFGIQIEYHPNFDYNWNRKLNQVAFHFKLVK